ncbi:uncharacterized protein MONOS_8889 [Monocercomonoides exilis]|uniref:uncharacterized protein n=1 Tax=Monocercomonoides exilis TaxID=2049356 RepID=UPI003559B799|nr:hypothetical protein MONOS_8889 [Monocercomonoides exilis]|eukprot:MONOS_8889.1-p1 / transcript=MONOS_8889.1 / gene=MONOS_8889 / organism=Monocercomonoides_exilis_PA203 / gene_product=unspecified product / transcript_product=unspecified product / location=Mono_scaffold00349:5410-8453(+) / protein_length=992 / sequence_SO=supercontig / SO=protein_coding / is_pseudo=false
MKFFLALIFCVIAEHTKYSLKLKTGNDDSCLEDHSKPCKTFSGLFRILDEQSDIKVFSENIKECQYPFSSDKVKEYVLFEQGLDEDYIYTCSYITEPLLKFSNIESIDFKLCKFSTSRSPILELSKIGTVTLNGCSFSGKGNEKGTGSLVTIIDIEEFYIYATYKADKEIMTSFEHHTIDGQGAGLYIDVAKYVEIKGAVFMNLTATQGGGLFVGESVKEIHMVACCATDTKATGEKNLGGGAGVYISSVSEKLIDEEKPAKLESCTFSGCDSGAGNETDTKGGFGGCVYTGRSITCLYCRMNCSHGARGSCLSINGRGIKAGQKCLLKECEFEGTWSANEKDKITPEVLLHVVAIEELNIGGNPPYIHSSFKNHASSLEAGAIFCADVDKIFITTCSFENCFGCDGGCIAAEPVADWQSEMSLLEITYCEMKGNEEHDKHSQENEPINSGAMIFARKVMNVTICEKHADYSTIMENHTSLTNERSGGVVVEEVDLLIFQHTMMKSLNGICGGAIFVKQNVKEVELKSVSITLCRAIYNDKYEHSGRGGAIFVADYAQMTTLLSCISSADNQNYTINLEKSNFHYCSAFEGGAIFLETRERGDAQRTRLHATECNFKNNKAFGNGGAIMIHEKRIDKQAHKEDAICANATFTGMKKRINEEVHFHVIENSTIANNECRARIEGIALNSMEETDNKWPVTPCGGGISIVGSEELTETEAEAEKGAGAGTESEYGIGVLNEEVEYLLLSTSTTFKNNTHSAIYASKGAKVKSDDDIYENNIEKDEDGFAIPLDVSCESSQVVILNPRNENLQSLCDEVCNKYSKVDASAMNCVFLPTKEITPSYYSFEFIEPFKVPAIEFKGKNLFPLFTPILWMGKSERSKNNAKDGIVTKLEARKEGSGNSSQYKLFSNGSIDISKFGIPAPSALYLHVSVDGGESWSNRMRISMGDKSGIPGYGIALIAIACVGGVVFVSCSILFCIIRRKRKGYNSVVE